MEKEIRKHVPNTWVLGGHANPYVNRGSKEYRDIERVFNSQNITIKSMLRVENVNRYGQYLLRQQLLARLNPQRKYYNTRRYVSVDSNVERTLKYHLDSRRIDSDFVFSKNPIDDGADVIFIVMCTDPNPNSYDFEPSRDTDFYISHIVYLE